MRWDERDDMQERPLTKWDRLAAKLWVASLVFLAGFFAGALLVTCSLRGE